MKARPTGFLFEGANPRHEHEWEDLAGGVIPDDKVLIPGVIDSTSNFVEHPRLIAQRLRRYADIVGRERVIAGADCGFGTFAAAVPQVATSIVWAKFEALAEGRADRYRAAVVALGFAPEREGPGARENPLNDIKGEGRIGGPK